MDLLLLFNLSNVLVLKTRVTSEFQRSIYLLDFPDGFKLVSSYHGSFSEVRGLKYTLY